MVAGVVAESAPGVAPARRVAKSTRPKCAIEVAAVIGARLPHPVRRRLAHYAADHELADDIIARIAAILELLAQDEHAPTPIRDPSRAVDVHVADSLSGLRVPALAAAVTTADLGSGVGFPGLVLAAARPHAAFTLVESVERKARWLRRCVEHAGLVNVTVVAARAEVLPSVAAPFTAVTARALAALPVLVEYAAPLLEDGGVLVAWKGAPEPGETGDGVAAAQALGMEPVDTVHVEPYPGSGVRRLFVYRKVAPTPPGYPRRPGMATKRPISASTRT